MGPYKLHYSPKLPLIFTQNKYRFKFLKIDDSRYKCINSVKIDYELIHMLGRIFKQTQ